jgi:hypothetical protein
MIRPKKRPEGLKPVGGDSPKASDRTKSGAGGKGGRKDVNPSTKSGKSAITRSRGGGFGYYDDRGKYVSAFTDAIDGGGKNQSGTYFAGGPLSDILNVMKVAPKGSGDVPRERIGYRDLTDMFDQGGPQASGGGFRGAGGFSGIGNIANMLTGNQSERVGYYDEGGRFYEPPAPAPSPSPAPTAQAAISSQPSMVNPMSAGYVGASKQAGSTYDMEMPQNRTMSSLPNYLMHSSMQMPVENAPSAYNTAQTTYGQDMMLQMARDAVAQSMGVEAYAMLPREEKQFREQQALNQIMSSMQ